MTLCRASGSHSLAQLVALLTPDTVGFAYTPRAALWLRLVGGRLVDHEGKGHDETIYELRLFDGASEWRWRKDGGVTSSACVGERAAPAGFAPIAGDHGSISTIVRRSLLWGTALEPGRDGWTRLGTPRIRAFFVPILLGQGEGASLEIVEYLGRLDAHGNVGVIDERIVGLSKAVHPVEVRS